MHGIGNDFVMVDCVRSAVPAGDPAVIAREVCDRRFGVGADGLIYIEREPLTPNPSPPEGRGEFRMRMWNPDGSESEMCGNGIRCVARYLVDEGIVARDPHPLPPSPSQGAGGRGILIETGAGLLELEPLADGRVRVDMGRAHLTRGEIGMVGPADERFVGESIDAPLTPSPSPPEERGGWRGTAVSMGNPHLVVILGAGGGAAGAAPSPALDEIDLKKLGPVLERHPLFPNRVNVHFVEVVDRGHIRQRTWERGAGATLACGTGACACVVAAFLNGRTGRVVDVDLPGGRLRVEYAEDGRVFMTGPAETVFDGEWALA
jgi:diaminopimelate epimerase